MMKDLKMEYKKIVESFKGDDEALGFIAGRMSLLGDYVQAVYRMEALQPVLYAKYEGAELRDSIMNLDRMRRAAHEAAIDAVRQINRICHSCGLPVFYEGDESDRYEIADFCEEVTHVFFAEREK